MTWPHRPSARAVNGAFFRPVWPLCSLAVAYPIGIGRKTAPTAVSVSFVLPKT